MTNQSIVSSNQKLDNFPELIYYHVFKYMDLDDVLDLRLINKRFYSIVKSQSIKQLCFLGKDRFGVKSGYFSTTEPTRLRNRLDVSKLGYLLKNPSDKLLNLKFLKFDCFYLSFKLEAINKFSKLQILVLVCMKPTYPDLLQLPELKSLCIAFDFEENFNSPEKIVIDTPNLHNLRIKPFRSLMISNHVIFKHPKTIKYLKTFKYENLSFENLECLELDSAYDLDVDQVLKLKNLQRIFIINSYSHWPFIDITKNLIKSKRDGQEIIINGIKIKEINRITNGFLDTLLFQLDNYDELVDNLNFQTFFRYMDLLEVFPTNQPADLFKKYNNIKTLTVDIEVKDENRLINFIEKCSNLEALNLYNRFSLQFYEKLPEVSSLTKLKLEAVGPEFNFERILNKMPYLVSFFSDHSIMFSQFSNLNNLNSKYLTEFFFSAPTEGKSLHITKLGKDKYLIGNSFELKFNNPPNRKVLTFRQLKSLAIQFYTKNLFRS